MGLNIFLIEVYPGVYPSIRKAPYSIFVYLPEFSVASSAVFRDSLEHRILVRYILAVTLRPSMQDGADFDKAPRTKTKSRKVPFHRIKVLQVAYASKFSLR